MERRNCGIASLIRSIWRCMMGKGNNAQKKETKKPPKDKKVKEAKK